MRVESLNEELAAPDKLRDLVVEINKLVWVINFNDQHADNLTNAVMALYDKLEAAEIKIELLTRAKDGG